jgi:hypothetical protein
MKKQTNNPISFLSQEDVQSLTTEVKETIAAGYSKPRVFSAAELWDIQRRGRTLTGRRY